MEDENKYGKPVKRDVCFFCGREYFIDDPEYDHVRRICDHCADALITDNPYIN